MNSLSILLPLLIYVFQLSEEASDELDNRLGQHHVRSTPLGDVSVGVSDLQKGHDRFAGVGEFGMVFEIETNEILPKLISFKPFLRNHFLKESDSISGSDRVGVGLETRWTRSTSSDSIVFRMTADEPDPRDLNPREEFIYSAGVFYEISIGGIDEEKTLIHRLHRLAEPFSVQIRISESFRNYDPSEEERKLAHYVLFSKYVLLIQEFQNRLKIDDKAFPFKGENTRISDIESWILDRIVERYPLNICYETKSSFLSCERLSDIDASENLLWDPQVALSDYLKVFEKEFLLHL